MTSHPKIIFITGATSGIGKACAELFAKQKHHLILCARRFEKLQEIANDLMKHHDIEVLPLPLDVSKENDVFNCIESLPEKWRDIDILINNAGFALGLDLFQDAVVHDWNQMIDVNIKGLLYVTKAVLPNMLEKNSGHIINISSVAGHGVYAKGSVYCATKSAVDAITKGLRFDLLGKNIRVSAISPGLTETEFSLVRFKGDSERAKQVYENIEALKPEDIADIVAYIISAPPHVNICDVIVTPVMQAGFEVARSS